MGSASGFRKRRVNPPRGFFEAEAAGLQWLSRAEPADGVPVVKVLDVAPDSIVLERLSEIPPSARSAGRFGEQLARTHLAGAAGFGVGPDGWTGDGFIGEAPLPLRRVGRERRSWGAFYAHDRVLPYVRAGADRGLLDPAHVRLLEAVCSRLADAEFDDDAPPARLHGDLWSGNVLWTRSGCVLIDPAAHGGNRETDLAMLALFGLPHLETVLQAYQSVTALTPGWRGRVGLHQLHPLLVHVVLFGGGYVGQTIRVARRFA